MPSANPTSEKLEPIPPDGALDPTDTAQPICSKPAHRNKHRVLIPPSRVRRDRDSPTTLIAESRLRRSAAKMKVDAKPHAAGESAVAEVSQAFFDPARLIFDNLVICGYRRSRLGKCSLSRRRQTRFPRAAARFGDFTAPRRFLLTSAPACSPRASPFALCADPDTRPARTSRPRGIRRPDLHPGCRDTPAPAVHRAPRLHRARVRQPAQWSSGTRGSERRFDRDESTFASRSTTTPPSRDCSPNANGPSRLRTPVASTRRHASPTSSSRRSVPPRP